MKRASRPAGNTLYRKLCLSCKVPAQEDAVHDEACHRSKALSVFREGASETVREHQVELSCARPVIVC